MDDTGPDDILVDDGVVLPVVKADVGNDDEDLRWILNVTDGTVDMSVNDLTRWMTGSCGCFPVVNLGIH